MKPALTITDQISLLEKRGLIIQDVAKAEHFLYNVSYYRLKGYWWDMQSDPVNHVFKAYSSFETIIERYTFDRKLKLILFNAIERIEIALRTKMIYHLSHSHGPFWYKDYALFANAHKHQSNLGKLIAEFGYSKEVFVKNHKQQYPTSDPEAFKILEVASLGVLSKIYKNLNNQMPEKAMISKGMGLVLFSELSSWLEATTYIRNIIAHHSRLWSRNMVKQPKTKIKSPRDWFANTLQTNQVKKPFLIISAMIYLCDHISPNHSIKKQLKELITDNSHLELYKYGFQNDWESEPLWQ